jgi:solute carrier family 36 (proton-coupled amino acid transporter)
VFISSNIKGIADLYTEEKTDVRLIMLIILLPLIFLNWVRSGNVAASLSATKFQSKLVSPQIRNLKFLAPFSTFANFITMISFGLIAYYIFETPFTIADKHAYGSLKSFPLFFGTVLFALEAIGVVSATISKRFQTVFMPDHIDLYRLLVCYVSIFSSSLDAIRFCRLKMK